MHSTNYINTFIAVAEDCSAQKGMMPPLNADKKTIANIQFDMLYEHPYEFTSDDVVFHAYAIKNNIALNEMGNARKQFFSKGQACLRASPLTKRYGWGVHNNAAGKVALYGIESKEYQKLVSDKMLDHTKAMRSKK